ncbi:hypothetical protein ABW21_db0202449 [Orbilia brochopaga]|nr:hypothetical protein ABW21_db0202449 [Drechslerella brochopaga]
MFFHTVALTVGAAIAALVTAAPTNPSSLQKRDYFEFVNVWDNRNDTSEAYSRSTDEAWARVDFRYPIQIFNTTSSVAYISMDGLISFEEPSASASIPSQPLPVDPNTCGEGRGCIARTALAALWTDLYIMPNPINLNNSKLNVTSAYHERNHADGTTRYHTFRWWACDKAISSVSRSGGCGFGRRFVKVDYADNEPGVFKIVYAGKYGAPSSDAKPAGVIGVQSYPHFLTTEFPVSKDLASGVSCVTIIPSRVRLRRVTMVKIVRLHTCGSIN